ncbi:hypothetical protein DFA_00589 [Cavenderia fasciculata]|uniref:Paramecium surface antigen repeat-containing protein n=1 Tax=Cavenderia fasciculata TaxID=261658 RepID=F4PSN4_CACFS|nr:uncharacterized protein DFA_00589 [Cavenderia fasciculata]EGG20726.1 hypothetical protein DFA_00589 [Cavenderia fasciculata]|eukprot:XP_004358576.1 hypothetical protein DFA_00589 [Cavenderia fasciculata]
MHNVMNHLLVIIGTCFLLLVSQLATAQDTCYQRYNDFCVTEGEACKTVYGGDTYHCVDGTYCNQLNYKCEQSSDVGQNCTTTGNIIPCKEWLSCISGVCVEAEYADVGESCSENYQCNSNSLTCSNGKCQNIDTKCADDSECSYFNYCRGSICTARADDGEICSADCLPHSLCNRGMCIPKYSLQFGANCSSSSACDVSQGLECDSDTDKCAYANFTKTLTPATQNCTAISCENEEFCVCSENEYTGFCAPYDPITESQIKSCGSSTKEFYDCLAAHECLYSFTDNTPSSCQLKHCGSSFCSMNRDCEWKYTTQAYGKGCSDVAFLEYQQTCQYLGYSATASSSSLSIPSSLISMLVLLTVTILSIYFESCTQDYQCNSDRLTCTNGYCQNIDATCTSNRECSYSNYCSTNICKARSDDGESCSSNVCLPHSTCNSGVCIPNYSLSERESCSSDDACDISQGLECMAGDQIRQCGSSTKDFYDCLADHECIYRYTEDKPSSCQLKYCASDFSAMNRDFVGTCFLLLVSQSTVVAQNFCQERYDDYCVRQGESCKAVLAGETFYCVDGTYCSQNGTCQQTSSEGQACGVAPCKEWLNCVSGTCVETGYATVGEACTEDYQCSTFGNLACTNGICQDVQPATCISSGDCSYFEICNGTVCVPRILDGQACKDGTLNSRCLPFSKCYNGICTRMYSLGLGALCDEDRMCDISQGLEYDGYSCVDANLNQTSASNVNCTATECLDVYENCICTNDPYTGVCFYAQPSSKSQVLACNGAKKQLTDCLADNECYSTQSKATPSSCQLKHCAASFCEMNRLCEWKYDSASTAHNCDGAANIHYQATCQYLGFSISTSSSSSPSLLSIPSLISMLLFTTTITLSFLFI